MNKKCLEIQFVNKCINARLLLLKKLVWRNNGHGSRGKSSSNTFASHSHFLSNVLI